MSFDLQAFITAPSQELLDLAKKSDLLDIAAHYELTTVNKSMLKQEIKNILVQFLVDKEILDSSALSLVLVTQTGLQMREVPGLDFIRRKWLHVIINDDFLEKGECYDRALLPSIICLGRLRIASKYIFNL